MSNIKKSVRCGVRHPTLLVRCEADARFPNHSSHFGRLDGLPVEWPNPEYVAPPIQGSREEVKAGITTIASEFRSIGR